MAIPEQFQAVEAIRKRPGMYIGDPCEGGVEHLIYELVANSIDLFLGGKASKVRVTIRGTKISVSDDGPGLPFDHAETHARCKTEEWLTHLHDTPTADGHAPHVHLNTCGLGLVVVNALSSQLKVVSRRDGTQWERDFAKGEAIGAPQTSDSSAKGTTVTFTVDREVLQASLPRMPVLRRRLFEAAHLFPGMTFQLNRETFHAPGGLADYVQFLSAKPDDFPSSSKEDRLLHVRHESDEITLEAAATGSATTCEWLSWCNGTQTRQHGTHVDGFREALRRAGWTPASAAINVTLKNPRFAGPTRAKVANPELRGQVHKIISEAMKRAKT